MAESISLKEVESFVNTVAEKKDVRVILNLMLDYDHKLYEHCTSVAMYCCRVGVKNGFSKRRLETLVEGALLHDCGMIFIPKAIYNKPTYLSANEYEIVKSHPGLGRSFLKPTECFDPVVLDIVLHHHERVDGSGYPDNLEREELLTESQIVSACDVLDAMTRKKPYREAYSVFSACEYMFHAGNFSLTQKMFFDMCCGDIFADGKFTGKTRFS